MLRLLIHEFNLAVMSRKALALVQAWAAERGLTLHPTKTKIVDAMTNGFDFLGYHFFKHRRYPRRKSLAKFREVIRGKTRRQNGRGLNMIIADINRTLVGWFEYFQHSHRATFPRLDGWIRMRLRTILRRRRGIRGRAKGGDNVRYPNQFFVDQGLFNLAAAHASVSQSSRR